MASPRSLKFQERRANFKNGVAIKLLDLMLKKESNVCVAVDLTDAREVLELADTVGPYICCLKTHIDIVCEFGSPGALEWVETKFGSLLSNDAIRNFTLALEKLAEIHEFVIFEDRKFADIGRTVQLQYSYGAFNIVDWADLTNAHIIPGEGIITGLKEVGLSHSKPRALLLLAEMSSKGSLAKGAYSQQALAWAKDHRDFVIGFIGQHQLEREPVLDWLYMTPGVKLSGDSADAHGQQYRTPRTVIIEDLCDIIIVGRGVYDGVKVLSASGKRAIVDRCRDYRREAWDAYLERTGSV